MLVMQTLEHNRPQQLCHKDGHKEALFLPCLISTKDLFPAWRSSEVSGMSLLKPGAHWHYQHQAEYGAEHNSKERQKERALSSE
jgi:hypothetical protein